MNIVPLDQINYESFAGLENTEVTVWLDANHTTTMKVVEITPHQIASSGGVKNFSYEHFALLFLGSPDQILPQRIYEFESAKLGRFEMFIVPLGRDANGTKYQAAFSRTLKPA